MDRVNCGSNLVSIWWFLILFCFFVRQENIHVNEMWVLNNWKQQDYRVTWSVTFTYVTIYAVFIGRKFVSWRWCSFSVQMSYIKQFLQGCTPLPLNFTWKLPCEIVGRVFIVHFLRASKRGKQGRFLWRRIREVSNTHLCLWHCWIWKTFDIVGSGKQSPLTKLYN